MKTPNELSDTPDTIDRQRRRPPYVEHVLAGLMALAGLGAVASLVLEYGFERTVVPAEYLHAAQIGIVAMFVLDRFGHLLLAAQRRQYLRDNFLDFLLIGVAIVVMAISFKTMLSAGALYVFITQAYILVALVLRGVSLNLRFAGSGINPGLLLIGSFAFLILTGAGLLMLPVAVKADEYASWYFLDSLFTATSATCVTGLVVTNTGGHFTAFGQAVILALIQCGGLGIMLFGTVLGMLVGRTLTMRQSTTIGEMVATEGAGRIARVVVFVIAATLAIEAAGAVALHPMFAGAPDTYGRPLSAAGAVWHSVFHSISAFCNAGLALYDKNLMQGVEEGWTVPALRSHWQVLGVIAPLIVLGGLGFPVLQDSAKWLIRSVWRLICRIRTSGATIPHVPPKLPLSLHSKIAIATSLLLIFGGAGLLILVEETSWPRKALVKHDAGGTAMGRGDWQRMSWPQRASEAVFQSVSARTAGFNTIDLSKLSNAGKLVLCVLMVIGGSPASTAGGMKTVTFAVLILTVWSHLRNRSEVEAFRRSIPVTIIRRSVTVAILYVGLLSVITLLLCIAQGPGWNFVDLLLEVCSACGTVGLSTGVTNSLTDFGKLDLIAAMFIGRVGPLTLLAALTGRLRRVEYVYPAESLIIG